MSIRQPSHNFKLIIDGVTYDIDEPKGFAELRSRVVRDRNYHGVFYEMTPEEGIDLGFSGIAKGLLRAAFDADGVDSLANINFQVDKVDLPDAEATRIFGDSATTELAWDSNTDGFAQKFTLAQAQVLTKARLYFGANTGSPTSTINAYICSVSGTTLANLTGPINFTVTPSGYTEFDIPYDLEAGNYALKFVSANDGTLDGSNYYTILIINDASGNFLSSTNSGSTWSVYGETNFLGWEEVGTDTLPDSGRYFHVFLSKGTDLFVIGGIKVSTRSRKVFKSSDNGANWAEIGTDAFPVALQEAAGCVYDDGGGEALWVSGGYDGAFKRKVYKSTDDGATWSEVGTDALPVALVDHTMRAYNGKMWITGGRSAAGTYEEKTYYSTNGSAWSEAGTDSLPSLVAGHAACEHDGNMVIAGGLPLASVNKKRVIYSTGGITWSSYGNVLPYNIYRTQIESFLNKIFLVGGDNGIPAGDNVYSSPTGASWGPEAPMLLVDGIREHRMTLHASQLYITGGRNISSAMSAKTIRSTTTTDSTYDLKCGITLEPFIKTVYLGNVDFSHATEDQDYMNVKILKSDVLIDVLNNRDIKINIADSTALDGTAVYGKTLERVFMDSFPINKQWKGRKINDFAQYTSLSTLAVKYFTFSPDDVILIEEIDEHQNVGISEFVTTLAANNSDAIWIADSDPDTLPVFSENIGETIISIGFSCVIEFELFIATNVTVLWQMYIDHYGYSNNLLSSTIIDSFTQSGISGGHVEISETRVHPTDTLTTNLTLESGDYIKIYFKYSVSGDALDSVIYKCTQGFIDFSIKIATIQPYSIIKGLKVFDALEGALQVMTGQQNPLISNFFNIGGCGYYTFITNGWNVRNFENKPIITSFKKLFDGLQAIFGLGYGIENGQVRVELWEHFYQNAQLIDLGTMGAIDDGKIGEYKEEVVGDMIFNKIVLGFENYADDEKMSDTVYDFHTISEWNTPIKNHKGEFRQVSSLILSPYLHESTRRVQFLNRPTESFRWDDHLFMHAIEDYYDISIADYQVETNETIVASGIPSPTNTPNLRYTIKRMLLNWGVWINSFAMRYKEITESVKNTFFKNNGSLVTTFSDAEDCLLGDLDRATLTENADITKEEIQNGTALFDQIFIHFKRKLSDEELEIIKSAHDGTGDNYLVPLYGYIKLRNNDGNIVTGWLMDMNYNIFSQVADFILIKRYVAGETIEPGVIIPEGLIIAIGSYSNVGQRFSVAAGTLVSVKVTVDTTGGTVNLYIAPVLWDGLPDTSNKIYENNVTLAVGENTIALNLAITIGGVYMMVFEYISTTVYLTTVDQTGYFTGQTDQYLARQINDGVWNIPSEQYPVKYFVNSIPTLASNKYWFSSGIDYTDSLHSIDRTNYQFIANTIQFLTDVQVKTIEFYITKTGSPTAVLQGVIYSLDENDKPNSAVCYTGSITPVNGVNSKDFTLGTTTLTKGRYAIVISASVSGTLDTSNKYSLRATSNQDVFRAGVMYKKGLATSNLWVEFSYDLVFRLTYESV